jgi:hypothetical protein
MGADRMKKIMDYDSRHACAEPFQAKRPHFQFSLKELFSIILLTCCVTAWANAATSNWSDSSERFTLLVFVSIISLALQMGVLWLIKTGHGFYLTAFPFLALLTTAIPWPHSHIASPQTAAAASCKAYAEAQEIYHRTDWDGDGVLEYAQDMQELIDHKTEGDDVVALIDRAFANADARRSESMPKYGYLYRRLLYRVVNGKAKSFIVNGDMIEGYAFVAFPSEYDETGRSTFVISSIGTIYQKDLGPDTTNIAKRMTVFDVTPGTGWVPTE